MKPNKGAKGRITGSNPGPFGLGACLRRRFVEDVQSTSEGQYLHGTAGVEHVGIVTRRGAESASLRMPALESEIHQFRLWKSSGMAEQMEGGQAPVYAVEAKVLGQPVLVLVGSRVERNDIANMAVGDEGFGGSSSQAGAGREGHLRRRGS
jgi:hypothetical protein